MAFVDYYQILDLEPSADDEAVKKAVRSRRRDWTHRQGHPDAEVRSRAERMTQTVSDAEVVLLDGTKRSAFDRERAAQARRPAEPTMPNTRDWVLVAREYLESGNASQANYAAREATSHNTGDPEAWYLRGQTSVALDNLRDAEFELSEATRLNPQAPHYYCELGDLYASADLWSKAQVAYQQASNLDPDSPYYRAGVATALIGQDRPAEALPLLEWAMKKEPGVELFRYHYAMAILDTTTSQWSTYSNGTSNILSEAQLDLTKKALAKVDALKISDSTAKAQIAEIRQIATTAEAYKWHGSGHLREYVGGWIASFILMLILFSFKAGVVIGVFMLIAFLLIPVIFVVRHRMAGWKWNRKHSPRAVADSGLQVIGSDTLSLS